MKNQSAVALGSIKSERKSKASKENGKRGGRPRKPMEIPLTQGKVALVDREDYEELNKYKWYAHRDKNTFYAQRMAPRDPVTNKQIVIHMHREIMNTPDGMYTDHIDNDGLNNQKSNLRICTNSENSRNRGASKNNKSGLKGVSFNKRERKWYAHIRIDGKQQYLGIFTTPLKAYEAYCEACTKYHGEFARLK